MKECKGEILLVGISLTLLSQILLGAFSLATRNAIRDRVRKKYGRLQSEKSGKNDEPLECAHINHNPRFPKYDHPSNGRLLTLSEHLEDHRNRAGRNGLTPEENEWAIDHILKRLSKLHRD